MKKYFLFALAAVILTSCKKDEDQPVVFADYGNLKVGNYWVYQQFEVDTLGNVSPLDVFDSCFIEKDTLIHGNTFCKMVRPYNIGPFDYSITFLRDSLDYIVNSAGLIEFSAEDFETIFLSDSLMYRDPPVLFYKKTSKMADKDLEVITPAGNFITRSFRTTYEYSEAVQVLSPRYMHNRYAKVAFAKWMASSISASDAPKSFATSV